MTTVSRSQNSDNTQPTTSFAKGRVNRLGYSQALDDAIWGPMPAYSDDPFLYERRMRARFAHSSVLERAGLRKKDINTNVLIGEVVDVLKAGGDFGNERYAWQLFHRRVHKYMKVKAENVANKPETVLRNEGAALCLSAECIEQILHTPSGKGGLAGNMEFYRDKMRKEAGIGMYETGFEPDIAAAKETMEAFEAAEANRKAAKQPSVLDTAFPRDANGEPIGLGETKVDDPATQALNAKLETLVGADEEPTVVWSAVDEPEGKQQTPAFVHFRRELLIIDPKADTTAHILKALGEPLGPHIEAHGIALTCGKLQEYLNDLNDKFRNAPEPQGATKAHPPAIPVPGSTSDAPEAAPVRSETIPQKEIVGMLKVYPVDFGSIYYKGIKFSVTLEAGGTFEQAIQLMEEFAKHRELIAPNCLVVQQPANVTPLPQSAPQLPTVAPTVQPNVTPRTPDGKGRVPGGVGSTVVTGVEVSKKNGKLIVELWSTGKYPEHSLKLDAEHAMITALGYSVEKMEIGTRYPINWTSDWVVSGNRANDGKGNYYLNVTGIRDNAVSVPKIA